MTDYPPPTPEKEGRMASVLTWIHNLSRTAKTLSGVGVLLAAGWTGHVAFSAQVGLPSVVGQSVERITGLESRMERAERIILANETGVSSVFLLERRVDSLYALQEATYCIVRAHALDLDPLAECTLNRRTGGVR